MEENKNLNEQFPEEPISEEQIHEEPAPAPEAAPTPAPKKKKKVGLILGIIFGAIALIVAAIIIFSVLSGNKDFTRYSFINEIGGTSETFTGVVSEYEYYSADEAAEEYVHREISGDDYVTVNSVILRNGAVEPSGIIPEELLSGSDLVEMYEVEFTRPSYAAVSSGVQAVSSYENGNSERAFVYVIRYGENKWRYYTPMPGNGDLLNHSYFKSIFDSEKYNNCTFEIVRTTKTSTFGFTASTSTITWLMKIADGKFYLEQTVETSAFFQNNVQKTNFYLEATADGDAKCYIQENGGEWEYRPNTTVAFYNGLYVIDTVDEFTPFFDHSEFSSTYFEKTNYGFEVPEEKGKDYFMDTYYWRELSRALRSEGIYVYDEDTEVEKLYAEYFVQEGALTGMRMNGKVTFTDESEGITLKFTYETDYVAKITNYGSTVIESPVN